MQLVGIVHHRRQVGRHEGRWKVRLHVRCLIRDQSVGRGMGFVKAISRELFHQVEYFARLVPAQTISRGARGEDVALLGHFLGLFLAHGAA